MLSTRKSRALAVAESRQSVYVHGFNSATEAGDLIWSPTGAYAGLVSSAVVLEALSGDADDDDGDTGARTIRVEGLDENWDYQTEDFTMNGTSVVAGALSWIRVNRAYVLTAGSSGVNEGLITVRAVADTPVMASIAAGRGESQMALYSVPRFHKAFLQRAQARATLSNNSDLALVYRAAADVATSPLRTLTQLDGIAEGGFSLDFGDSILLPEKSDVYWTCVAGTTGDPVTASFTLDLLRQKSGAKIPD